MLIDWFTVGAQVLNFIVLVWLMKRFLYGPILKAVETRDTRVAAELADAEATRLDAQQSRDEFQQKNATLDQEREALMNAARDKAGAEEQRLLAEAREAAEAASTQHQQALSRAAEGLQRAIAARAQQEVFAIARKTLADLASTSLEERLTDVFVRRLRSLDADTKAELATALESADGPARVRSAFELPDAQKAVLENAVHETFSMDVALQFETAPELVSGIELTTNGRKLAWSIADYLRSLSEGVRELVGSEASEAVAPHAA